VGASSDLVVVGAGPAGLTAAWRAARAGRSVRVLDGAAAIGGMAASTEVGGQRVDLGSHRLHPSTPPHLLAALRALLGDDLQTRPRHGRLHLRGRWIGFPLRPVELMARLPPAFAAVALRDAACAPLRRPRDDTFAEVVRAGLGPAMLRDFYGPYAEKLWGRPPGELAGDLARRRIAASSPSAMLRKVARGTQPAKRTFLYPRLGYGQIVERLGEAAVAAGARIELGSPVDDLAALDAAQVLWTAPLTALARAGATSGVDAAVTDASARLVHRAMTLVYLVLAQPQYTEFDAHYVPDAAVSMTRLSEPKNYRDGPDPVDRTVLCAEIPCARDDATWRATDADLGARVVDELVRIGLPAPRVAHVEVRRLPSVYPVVTAQSLRDLAVVDAWASSLAGVTVLGRQGLFVADNLHHVMDMGWSAAEALRADGSLDRGRWAAERARFNRFVVED
jgi:protoporphyrinogen oxidase